MPVIRSIFNSNFDNYLVSYPAMLEKGLVQIYTGDGKGKTTAALGLALRAAGHGNRVLIYQFLKPGSLHLGERIAVEKTGLPITIKTLDAKWDVASSPNNPSDVEAARAEISFDLKRLTETAGSGEYDVIILDEIVYCLSKGLALFEDIKRLIENKNPRCELVLTGRGASDSLMRLADLVTVMNCGKHPYNEQTPARKGIEY